MTDWDAMEEAREAMGTCTYNDKKRRSKCHSIRRASLDAVNPSPDSFSSHVRLNRIIDKPVESETAPEEIYRMKVDDVTVDIRPLKTMLEQKLPPNHPLRVLVVGEPDFMPRGEYRSKLPGWFRILMNRAD
jgi:hypothetical protein